jgi:hypothetical protein
LDKEKKRAFVIFSFIRQTVKISSRRSRLLERTAIKGQKPQGGFEVISNSE